MNGIKICGTGSAIPAAAVSNADLARIVRTDDEWIRSRTGIERRHVAKKETHLSLCTEAARSALAQANLDPSQIGVCIVATFTPDTIVPSAACLLQRELSLPQTLSANAMLEAVSLTVSPEKWEETISKISAKEWQKDEVSE